MNAATAPLTPPASLPDACGCDHARGSLCWEHARRTIGSRGYLIGLRAAQGWTIHAREVLR